MQHELPLPLVEEQAVGEIAAEERGNDGEVDGVVVCLANVNGELSALDNMCPHRQGPLGQGWLEGDTVVCPWHSWAFHVKTGLSEYPASQRVDVLPLQVEGDDVLVNIE